MIGFLAEGQRMGELPKEKDMSNLEIESAFYREDLWTSDLSFAVHVPLYFQKEPTHYILVEDYENSCNAKCSAAQSIY